MGLTFCGAVVRTTHMTGVATDIGNVAGRSIGRTVANITITPEEMLADRRSLLLLCMLMVGYITGSYCGAVLLLEMGDDAILFPATISLVLGLSYTFYRTVLLKQGLFTVEMKMAMERGVTASQMGRPVGRPEADWDSADDAPSPPRAPQELPLPTNLGAEHLPTPSLAPPGTVT